MPSSNGGQVPPFPDGALEATRDPRLIGQEDGGRVAYAEIGKDLLHLCCEIFRTNPERGRDSAAADPRQPTAELMPQLPLALRDRVRNQAPTVRGVHLARCVDAPVASLQGRNGGWPQRVTGTAIPHLGIEQALATHPKYGCPGPRLADPHRRHQLGQGRDGDPATAPTQIAADDGAKQRGCAAGARVRIIREALDLRRRRRN